jgi:4-hydroxy-4-methyl-2-oxoglutarate aldolase
MPTHPSASMADALLDRLGALDSCVVSDALDRLALPGTVHGIGRLWPCRRVAGRVVTVELALYEARAAASVPHLGTRAIEAAAGEHVIVIANHGRLEMAGWGGLLSRAARARGVRGVIVDGAARDLDEAETLGFPIFARAAVPTTARGRVMELATGGVIEVGGVAVAPDDLVIADGSGVVFVAAASAEEAVATAEGLAEREASLAEQIDRGRPPTEVLGGGYERMVQS